VIAVATDKDQSQRIRLSNITLKKDSFVMPAVGTVGLLGTC
jgi:hypothetical protein